MKTLLLVLVALLLLVPIVSSAQAAPTVSATVKVGSPTTRVDGTPFNAVTDALKYTVYYALMSSPTATTKVDFSPTSGILASGVTITGLVPKAPYNWKVTVTGIYGGESVPTAIVTVTTQDAAAPSTPPTITVVAAFLESLSNSLAQLRLDLIAIQN